MAKHVHSSIDGDVWGTSVQTGDVRGDLNYYASRPANGSVLWFAVPAAILATAAAGLAGSADWQFIAGLVIAALVAGACGVLWWLRAPRRTASTLDLARLSEKIKLDWETEAVARDLARPRPLRLRWRPTERKVQAGSPEEAEWLEAALERETTDVSPAAHLLAKGFVRGSRHQLVVLGEPGAGKTTLAVLFTIAAASAGAVPVLLSASGWQPRNPETGTGEHVENWIARRVREDYQSLAVGVPVSRLLPVLDGLDEMPEESLTTALRDLNRAAGIGLRMVLTCRANEFEKAVQEAGALVHADVVDVQPVDVSDVEFYLTQPETSSRWDPVLARLAEDPGGPVAAALSTPLMISLARRVYESPRDDPAVLTEFATRREVETHLLDGFLATAYERKHDRDKARRWLSFLSHHLRDRVEQSDLEWWHLARAVPRIVLATLAGLFATVTGTLAGLLIGLTFDRSGNLLLITSAGAMVGLLVGVAASAHTARTAHAPLTPRRRNLVVAALDGTARDLSIIAAVLGGATAVVLFVLHLVDADSAQAILWWLRAVVLGKPEELLAASMVATLTLSLVTLTNGVEAGRAGRPCRSTSNVRALPLSLVVGMVVGGVIGSPWVVLGSLAELSETERLGMWLMTATLIGVPLGVSRWLATPAEWKTACSPNAVLRADRTATLLTAIIGGLCGGPAVTAALSEGFPGEADAYLVLKVAMTTAITIALFFGSGTAWLNYTLARLWLAARGRLPLRLMGFLRAAHSKGVLRHTGPAHQLRHGLLREHLADEWQNSHGRTPHRGPVRRWDPFIAVAVSMSLLFGVVQFARQRGPLHLLFLSDFVPGESSVAFSGDGSTLAAISQYRSVVTLWDSRSGEPIMRFNTLQPRGVSGVGLSHDGRTVTEASLASREYRRMNVTRDEPSYGPVPVAGQFEVADEQISPDGSTLALGGRDFVQVMDLATGLTRNLDVGPATWRRITFSQNGAMIAIVSGPTRTITVTDVSGGSKWTVPLGSFIDVAVSGDGDTIAMRDIDYTVHIRHRNGEHRSTQQPASALAFSHDSTKLALGDKNGTVSIWDTRTNTFVARWNTPSAPLSSIAFSPDGRTVATSSERGEVATWTIPTE